MPHFMLLRRDGVERGGSHSLSARAMVGRAGRSGQRVSKRCPNVPAATTKMVIVRLAVTGGILLIVGGAAIALGVLPRADAVAVADRVWPILLFVIAITIVAELAATAGVFDVAADFLARLARGRASLWLLVVLLAVVVTAFLSLDTTAVLLTPVVVAVARTHRLDPLPFAFTTVWLANTASLVLPVSNLTNLLAVDRLGIHPLTFARVLGLPALIAVVVTILLLWIVHRRSLQGTYAPAPPPEISDRVQLLVAAAVVVILLPLLRAAASAPGFRPPGPLSCSWPSSCGDLRGPSGWRSSPGSWWSSPPGCSSRSPLSRPPGRASCSRSSPEAAMTCHPSGSCRERGCSGSQRRQQPSRLSGARAGRELPCAARRAPRGGRRRTAHHTLGVPGDTPVARAAPRDGSPCAVASLRPARPHRRTIDSGAVRHPAGLLVHRAAERADVGIAA